MKSLKKLLGIIALIAIVGSMAIACSRDVTLTVINQSGYPIRDLFISPAGKDSWGQNLLTTILHQESRDIQIPAGNYDVRIIYTDNDTFIKRNVEAKSNASVTFVPGNW